MPKTLLLLGLGKYANAAANASTSQAPSTTTTTSLTPTTIKAAIETQLQTLSTHGFTCTKLDLNPSDPTDSLHRLRQILTSQPRWDGIVIGFGLRGNVELTELFEKVVNLSVEVCGGEGVRFAFSTTPMGVVEAVGRVWPEEMMEGREA